MIACAILARSVDPLTVEKGTSRSVQDRFGRTQEDLQSLEMWLKMNGATVRSLHSTVLNTSEGCGVVATSDFAQDETIALIPRELLMTTAAAKNISASALYVHKYFTQNKIDDWRAVLSIFLLEQRADPQSFWQPYARSLPRSLHHLPVFWGRETREWLQGSSFAAYVEENRKELLREWNRIKKAVPSIAESHTYGEYIWAASIVQSRSFAIATEKSHQQCGGESEKALVPLADLLNHRKQGSFTVSWGFDRKKNAFKLKAYVDIASGEALTDSYGESKSTDQFVRMYGFVPSTESSKNKKKLMPSLVTRNVNATHLSMRTSLRRWHRIQRTRQRASLQRLTAAEIDRSKRTGAEIANGKECDAPLKLRETDDTGADAARDDEWIDEDDKVPTYGSAAFRIRAKIVLPNDADADDTARTGPVPLYIEDSRFLSYLRGVAQTYLDAYRKASASTGDSSDDVVERESHIERVALRAANRMMKSPLESVLKHNIDVDAESLAMRMFADALDTVLRRYSTTLAEDADLLRRSRMQSFEDVLQAELVEIERADAERMSDEMGTHYQTSSKTERVVDRRAQQTSTITYNQQVALQLRMAEKSLVSSLRDIANEEATLLEALARIGPRGAAVEPALRSSSTSPHAITMPTEAFFVGDFLRGLGRAVWARWRKGNLWYKGYIMAAHNKNGHMTFTVQFDDGDREDHVTTDNILWGADPSNHGLEAVTRLGKKFEGRVLREVFSGV